MKTDLLAGWPRTYRASSTVWPQNKHRRAGDSGPSGG